MQQGWTAAQIAKRQHYPNIFETLARVTVGVSDWDSPSLDGASPDGMSQGDPALVDGSLMLDSPAQILDRVVIESEDESKYLSSPGVVGIDYRRCASIIVQCCLNVVSHVGDQLVSSPVVMRQTPRVSRKGTLSKITLHTAQILISNMCYVYVLLLLLFLF